MKSYNPDEPPREKGSIVLTVIGVLIVIIGAACIILPIIDIISNYDIGVPTILWLPFVGIFLLSIGFWLVVFGITGALKPPTQPYEHGATSKVYEHNVEEDPYHGTKGGRR